MVASQRLGPRMVASRLGLTEQEVEALWLAVDGYAAARGGLTLAVLAAGVEDSAHWEASGPGVAPEVEPRVLSTFLELELGDRGDEW